MILCAVISLFVVTLLLIWKNRLSPILKKSLLILLAAGVFGMFAALDAGGDSVLVDGNRLRRNPAGEGDYEQRLFVQADEKKEEIVIIVPEQQLTAAEEQRYLEATKEEIAAEFPGNNDSVDSISQPVVLRDAYQEGLVEAEWRFGEEVIDRKGNIVVSPIPAEGILAEAAVTLTCGDSECIYKFPFYIYPRVLSRKEEFIAALQGMLDRENDIRGSEYLTLPERVMDLPVTFMEAEDYLPEKIVLFGALVASLLPAAEQSRLREKKKKRERELLLEYPDMVSKLALLLGAGMTLSGAWERIVSSYVKGKTEGRKSVLPVYEEMDIAVHEMQSGVGEIKAYQHFGERCGVQRYRRLSSMLTQNLKKGNRRLMEMLLQEAENAFEERKNLAKKYGEEAGTKMLFPMIALLVVMMVILLVPAFLSFQM